MFIEIEKGLTINTSQVTVVEERDGGKSLIWTGKKSYASDIPYATIISMLKIDAKGASKLLNGLEALVNNYGQPSP